MSRFCDYDNDDEYWMLNMGRWERNSRAALKSKRGRKALAELREALMALPEHRLIDSAMCTVGGVDARLPAMSDDEARAHRDRLLESGVSDDYAKRHAQSLQASREEERRWFAQQIEKQGGEGVCVNGALLWYRKVQAGMDPAEAFAALPALWSGDEDGGDQLWETARLVKDEAGLAVTLAWNLAYRNDETYRQLTPEERWQRFVDWIDQELAEAA